MTRKTSTQEQKEIVAKLPQQLSEEDRAEFEELQRIAITYSFIASQIKANTALVPEGQQVAQQYEAISRLMQNSKNQWMGQKLAALGYPKDVTVTIDVKTGIITPVHES